MKGPIHIVCTIDDNYTQHCAVMLASLFLNNKNNEFVVYVITNGLRKENENKLTKSINKYKAQSHFYTIDESILKNAPITHHISLATYYRILLPEILPDNLNKILFLDSDIVVLGDVLPLWNTEIDNYYIGGCCEFPSVESKIKLGLNPESPYFNAGVMLVNLKKWRDDNISTKGIDIINHQKEKIEFWDQDTLNILFENQWKQLPHCWNVNQKFYVIPYSYEYFNMSEEEHKTFSNYPTILHYTGSDKPWNYNNNHPKKGEYFKYLSKTPWKKYKPENPLKFTMYQKIRFQLSKVKNLSFMIIRKFNKN